MTEFDYVLLPAEVIPFEPMLAAAALEGEAMLSPSAIVQIVPGGDSILDDHAGVEGEDWILLSSASSDALASGIVGVGDDAFLLNPIATDEEDEQVIIITGHDGGGGGGATGGEGGDTGYSGNGMGDGGTSGAPPVTPVEPHTQDCGSEDGAAVQVAKHVMGTTLPVGVAGPPDAVTTPGGNEWTEVEFGAVIVKNPDGTYGAFNNAIYSNDANGWVVLPMTGVQGFQGTWHNHPARDDPGQRAIDRYPSPADWSELASLAKQAGAASDPSIWLTDPNGVTREFKLSERGQFENMDPELMKNGEGLDGKERSQACG